MKRTLVVFIVVMIGCTSKSPTPRPADLVPRLAFMSMEHLETRTSLTGADFYFQNLPAGPSGEEMVAGSASGVHVADSSGQAVNASVEIIGSHYGDGLRITWGSGLRDGWYRVVIPTQQLPAFINASAWHQQEGEGSVWFRVGSQPMVRSVGRLRSDTSTFFEIHFSEVMRAETSNLEQLVRLFHGEAPLPCIGVVAHGSSDRVDLTKQFKSFSLKCEGADLDANRLEVSHFRTPEGVPVADVQGGNATFAIDWRTAAPMEGGLSEQWYESRLPR
jgi:hypothetical protein